MSTFPCLYNPSLLITSKDDNKLARTKAPTLWSALDAQSFLSALHTIHLTCKSHGSSSLETARQLSGMIHAIIQRCDQLAKHTRSDFDDFQAAEQLKKLARDLLINKRAHDDYFLRYYSCPAPEVDNVDLLKSTAQRDYEEEKLELLAKRKREELDEELARTVAEDDARSRKRQNQATIVIASSEPPAPTASSSLLVSSVEQASSPSSSSPALPPSHAPASVTSSAAQSAQDVSSDSEDDNTSAAIAAALVQPSAAPLVSTSQQLFRDRRIATPGENDQLLAQGIEIIAQVGKGSFIAKHQATNKQFFLKKTSSHNDQSTYFQASEIAISQRLTGHPNIAKFEGVYETVNGVQWLSFALAGGDMADLLSKMKGFSLEAIAFVLDEVKKALFFMHKRNVYHRNLKASNVLVTDKGHIVVSDFGVSLLAEAGRDVSRSKVGDRIRTAPEVFSTTNKRGHVASLVDCYCFGALAYELRTGHPKPADAKALRAEIKVLRSSTDPVESAFGQLLSWSLQPRDEQRRPLVEILQRNNFLQYACSKEVFLQEIASATKPKVEPDVEDVAMEPVEVEERGMWARLRAMAGLP